MIPSIPVFYTEDQLADARSFSPSAMKPREVVARWRSRRYPMDIRAPRAVTVDEIARAHDRNYVERVLALRANNGFGNRSASVARSLPWTSGSMLAAAQRYRFEQDGREFGPPTDEGFYVEDDSAFSLRYCLCVPGHDLTYVYGRRRMWIVLEAIDSTEGRFPWRVIGGSGIH